MKISHLLPLLAAGVRGFFLFLIAPVSTIIYS